MAMMWSKYNHDIIRSRYKYVGVSYTSGHQHTSCWCHTKNSFQSVVCTLPIRPLSINICLACHNISLLSEGISMKFAKNIHHINRHCWKCFQGQRSKVKVTVRPYALIWHRHVLQWHVTETRLLLQYQTENINSSSTLMRFITYYISVFIKAFTLAVV